ncbi:MAG: helix-turn-helix domain-containing protein, partial [Chloroflexota bacterium]
IYTSAGTAAGIDLCLHIVRLDFGAEVANMFARRMVVPPHRDGGQAQYVDLPLPPSPEDDDLGRTLAWVQAHLDQEISVPRLAGRAHMSSRTFARRFAAVTGTTPHRWVLNQRVLRAQRLLETTDLPVDLVAGHSGFGSAATLRQHFQHQLSTSPHAYRRTFRRSASA